METEEVSETMLSNSAMILRTAQKYSNSIKSRKSQAKEQIEKNKNILVIF
jgi:hypothetical protein